MTRWGMRTELRMTRGGDARRTEDRGNRKATDEPKIGGTEELKVKGDHPTNRLPHGEGNRILVPRLRLG